MAAYATYTDVQASYRELTQDEQAICTALLERAAIYIDAYNAEAVADIKKEVSVRMVQRALDSTDGVPMGATQGSMSAMGYSQSYTVGGGSVGELYIGKLEKKLLGVGNSIGSYSPIEELVPGGDS